ncbi:hypothetical protein GF386_01745, partial [Candidatus Pacearchaeota archaeon]|nr:hypothetical protein [Candidatus Pacearchaeota archaeon]MBD3282903.1 hypothetical protein [Candidatus Pacearchaeota archaeon]
MKIKRVLVIFLFIFLLVSLSVNSVSAYVDIRRGSEQLISFVIAWAEPFLFVLFGSYDGGYYLFEKFLFFIMLLAIVYIALSNIDIFDNNPPALWTVSIIVPILSVRFINWQWLNTVLLSYQVLGVALAGILPFIIYLYFLHNASNDGTVRKIGWIFFIVVYFGLWSTATTEGYSEIYFWTMIISLIFLIFDGTIHKALMKQKWKQAEDSGFVQAISKIDEELRRLREKGGSIPESIRKREERKLHRRRRQLLKHIS